MCHIEHKETIGVVTLVICTSRGLIYWMVTRTGDPHIPLESGSDRDPRAAREQAFTAFRFYCNQYNGGQS